MPSTDYGGLGATASTEAEAARSGVAEEGSAKTWQEKESQMKLKDQMRKLEGTADSYQSVIQFESFNLS
jgi:hypothetical protein